MASASGGLGSSLAFSPERCFCFSPLEAFIVSREVGESRLFGLAICCVLVVDSAVGLVTARSFLGLRRFNETWNWFGSLFSLLLTLTVRPLRRTVPRRSLPAAVSTSIKSGMEIPLLLRAAHTPNSKAPGRISSAEDEAAPHETGTTRRRSLSGAELLKYLSG